MAINLQHWLNAGAFSPSQRRALQVLFSEYLPEASGDLEAADLLPLVVGNRSRAGTVAIMFDDGYATNYTVALPLFKKYGFTATIAVEIERIGMIYGGDPLYPVLTVEQLRELIREGWEITNHPALNTAATEAVMVAEAQAENQLLRDLLTGAKVKNYTTGVVTAGTVTNPEFANHPINTAVYRGGDRNETSDRAYRYLFDKVRSINGPVATRGDHLYVIDDDSAQTMQMSAFPIDSGSNNIDRCLGFVGGVAQSGERAILYGHVTPATVLGGAFPYILGSDLDKLLAKCSDLGLAVVPVNQMMRGNAVVDTHFDASSGTFVTVNGGDVAAFTTTNTLNGQTRAVQLTAAAYVANFNLSYRTPTFLAQPFCRYRVRVRYRIDTELVLNGGSGNRNHGLNIQLSTIVANTAGDASATHNSSQEVLNDAAARAPYLATTGYDETSAILVTGNGSLADVSLSLYQCTGTVRIGQITVEKLQSLRQMPLSGAATFNTSLGSNIYLPNFLTGGSRKFAWKIDVVALPIEFSATYTYGYANSASITTPLNGQTAYVMGVGAGLFAGQSGKLATYDGANWAFSSIADGAFFKLSTANGIANIYVRHIGLTAPDVGPVYETTKASAIEDPGFAKASVNPAKVFNRSGLRSDAFSWVATPYAVA